MVRSSGEPVEPGRVLASNLVASTRRQRDQLLLQLPHHAGISRVEMRVVRSPHDPVFADLGVQRNNVVGET